MTIDNLKKMRANYIDLHNQADKNDSKAEDRKLRAKAYEILRLIKSECKHDPSFVFITREASPENFDTIVYRTCFMCGHQECNNDRYEEPKMKSSVVRIIKSFQFHEVFDFPLEPEK